MNKLGNKGLIAMTVLTLGTLVLAAFPLPEVVITGGRVQATEADMVVIGTNLHNPSVLPRWVTLTVTLKDVNSVLLIENADSGWIPAGETIVVVLAFEHPNIALDFYELIIKVR